MTEARHSTGVSLGFFYAIKNKQKYTCRLIVCRCGDFQQLAAATVVVEETVVTTAVVIAAAIIVVVATTLRE